MDYYDIGGRDTALTIKIISCCVLTVAACALILKLTTDHEAPLITAQQAQDRAQAEKMVTAQQHVDWVNYQKEFWLDHANDPPIMARVTLPDGKVIEGRIEFITDCPTGNWCAQPDGEVRDDKGGFPLVDEDATKQDFYEATYGRP